MTLEEKKINFINKSNEIHNFKYDYSKVEFKNSSTKVCIICPKHGNFYMLPSSHLIGQGCPKCSGRGLNLEEVIERAKEIHSDKYDYSKVVFTKMHDKVKIICPIHGEFEQTLSKHISKKQGCPKCGIIKRSKDRLMSSDLFFSKAREIHDNKYDYSNTEYKGMNHKITIKCPKHGEFEQRPFDHLRGFGCTKCANLESKKETNLYEFVKNITNCDVIHNDRKILEGKELDIYIPSKNIAIEYNGLRWHSELFGKDKWYHIDKLSKCNEKNVKLLQIFEDEYLYHKDIVLNKIKHILNINENLPKIMGRKCTIEIIDREVAEAFLNDYHIQGFARSTVYLGAVHDNELIAVMSFNKETKNSDKWELNRFASNYHYICQGVGGKLFKWFIKHYNPSEVKSFADRRWTLDKNNNLYTKLGFRLDKELNPDYEYILRSNPLKRLHKFNFRKQLLHKKYNLPLNMTEKEMTSYLGYDKIWNCGLFKYIWKI